MLNKSIPIFGRTPAFDPAEPAVMAAAVVAKKFRRFILLSRSSKSYRRNDLR